MKSLITGIGFAGIHLANYLIEVQGHEVLGLNIVKPKDLPTSGSFGYQVCDVTDASYVAKIIADFAPDHIFHLAAQSSVARSWKEIKETFNINLYGVFNVLSAAQSLDKQVTVHIACSSDEYGRVNAQELPLTEEALLRPSSPYALSKVFQDYTGVYFAEAFGIEVFRTRAFNHTGPGQAPTFVCSDFAMQIARIEAGMQEPVIKVGYLDAKRDFTDVRDVVAAYWSVVERGEPGQIYNICSGRSWSIAQILEILISKSEVKIETVHDPKRDRPSDIPELRGDYSKLNRATGWAPRIDIEETLSDILDYWRETLAVASSGR